MGLYRVGVSIEGILRVSADSPQQAEDLARRGTPMMNHKNLVAAKVIAEYLGPVENYVMQPDIINQSQATAEKPDK